MSGINFKGVEEAKDSTMTRPGTIDVFEIKEVKFETTKGKGTYYCGVTFARKNDNFRHSFFLTEKAVGRLKALIKAATGKVLEEEVFEDQIKVMLEGKKVALKVTGKVDETNGRGYPDLAFGGFAKDPSMVGELSFSDQENDKNKAALEAIAHARPEAADGAESEKTTAPAAGAPGTAKDEDIF